MQSAAPNGTKYEQCTVRQLSESSRRVLQAICDTGSDDLYVLATYMGVKPSTVKTYLKQAYKELRVTSKTTAIVEGVKLELISIQKKACLRLPR